MTLSPLDLGTQDSVTDLKTVRPWIYMVKPRSVTEVHMLNPSALAQKQKANLDDKQPT